MYSKGYSENDNLDVQYDFVITYNFHWNLAKKLNKFYHSNNNRILLNTIIFEIIEILILYTFTSVKFNRNQ